MFNKNSMGKPIYACLRLPKFLSLVLEYLWSIHSLNVMTLCSVLWSILSLFYRQICSPTSSTRISGFFQFNFANYNFLVFFSVEEVLNSLLLRCHRRQLHKHTLWHTATLWVFYAIKVVLMQRKLFFSCLRICWNYVKWLKSFSRQKELEKKC